MNNESAEVTIPNDELGQSPGVAKNGVRRKGAPLVTLDAEIFRDVDVSLTAILGRGGLTVRTLLDLEEGSVVDLDTPLDGTIVLSLNDRPVARGELVAVGDHFGVRITEIIANRT